MVCVVVLGNEATENRKGYASLLEKVRDSQCLMKIRIYMNWQEAEEINQNLLRGSKAIADRVDVGVIAMKTRAIDEDVVETFVAAGYPRPNYVYHFYKIRRGKYAGTKLWCHADLGTCRIDGLFVTGYDNQPIPVQGMDVKVVKAVQKSQRVAKAEKQMESAF